MRNDKYSVEKMAVSVTQLFFNKDIEKLNIMLERLGGEYDARLMALDAAGKVWVDTFSKAEGMRIQLKEVADVLQGNSQSYGVYKLQQNQVLDVAQYHWMNVCTVSIVTPEGLQGVLLYSSSLDDVMNNLNHLQNTILKFFGLAALFSLVFAFFLSGVITKPVASLTQGIQKMGRGDFSVRVPEVGSSEIKNLSVTFNHMSEKLENLEKSRNQFISNASHELKTPLATMKILLETILYQDDMDPSISKEFLDDINKEIDRLNSVIKDLLTLVSLDNKTVQLQKTQFNLSDLVNDIGKKMKMIADKKGKVLLFNIEENVDFYGDEAKLHHVVYNLVDNAVKYTGDDGVIELNLFKNGKMVILSVRDNGHGIPEEDTKHIFDRFYRVDKARSRETGGTGLGLSIVHQMVMLHGGKIYVESKEGEGSEFVVELPFTKKEAV
ncbi:MAG: HAMP domain-containing sensor histidine kinase [Eubacteriales bacterium]|nr:HAMP domain-containing sensor histidine kinase [Eubacteriales bacterium]